MQLSALILTAVILCTSAHAEVFLTLEKYVGECQQQNVTIPSEVSCLDGEELLVEKSTCDASGTLLHKTKIDHTSFNRNELFGKCDHPALVQKDATITGCIPHARLQVIQNKDQSYCALVCRRTINNQPLDRFNDLSMICYQPQNGATCFFNSRVNLDRYRPDHLSYSGQSLPGPNSPDKKVWMEPKELEVARCVRCHDNDPFIITPNLGSAASMLLDKKAVFKKYRIVGSGKPFTDPEWSSLYYLDEDNGCTSCHRIGSKDWGGCGYLRDAAVGNYPATPVSNCGYHHGWMPPKGHGKSTFASDIKRIRECCNDFEKHGNLKSNPLCSWKKL